MRAVLFTPIEQTTVLLSIIPMFVPGGGDKMSSTHPVSSDLRVPTEVAK